jgi:TPR repeat protein
MVRRRKVNWGRVMARLRRRAEEGDIQAITELGLNLFEGVQDQNGRMLVRKNAPYAVRLFRRAAEAGDAGAAGSLGLAYDAGRGIRSNKKLALKWYRRAVRLGDSAAANNISTVYRDSGDLRRAHHWMMRAVKMEDTDAALSAGYNYFHGIGVRRNIGAARLLFDQALHGVDTSGYGREEALYNLALADIGDGNRDSALQFLERANQDDDYPEAKALLAQLRSKAELTPCLCRRHLNKGLLGHARCPLHP